MESADNNMATKIDEATLVVVAARPLYFVSHRTQFNNQQGSSFSSDAFACLQRTQCQKDFAAWQRARGIFSFAVNFCNTCQLMFAPISTPAAFTAIGCLLSARESRDTPNKYTGSSIDNSLAAQGSLTSLFLFVV
jgi:hypothetical protein